MFRLSASPLGVGTLARFGAGARAAFVRTVAATALIKVALGLAVLMVAVSTGVGELIGRHALMLAHVVVFSATGLLLALGGEA